MRGSTGTIQRHRLGDREVRLHVLSQGLQAVFAVGLKFVRTILDSWYELGYRRAVPLLRAQNRAREQLDLPLQEFVMATRKQHSRCLQLLRGLRQLSLEEICPPQPEAQDFAGTMVGKELITGQPLWTRALLHLPPPKRNSSVGAFQCFYKTFPGVDKIALCAEKLAIEVLQPGGRAVTPERRIA